MADAVERKVWRSGWGSWAVVGLTVLVSVVLVIIIGSCSPSPGEHTPTRMPEESAQRCPELGIAGPAAWEEMSDRDFRAMLQEQVLLGSAWIRVSAEIGRAHV